MTIIPLNARVAAELSARGVPGLDPRLRDVPDEWLSLLEQMNGGAGDAWLPPIKSEAARGD